MQENLEKEFEMLKEIYSKAWSSAVAYTNFVMVAGYAGYFGLISMTKDYISPVSLVLSSSLLLISITVFVSNEIFKISSNTLHYYSKHMEGKNKIVDGLRNAKVDQDLCDIRNHKVWFVCFILSVVFGIAAVIVLFYSIVATIIHCFQY
ncbi:hypothetical protein [Aeromonas hydrophila]|uniref:hypothetical protein n=1 Tax=Aeromonas hydrophila TaxID=644 RepID=UPI002B498199|nr:hypothetical protein [Aeromonas hydrophila]